MDKINIVSSQAVLEMSSFSMDIYHIISYHHRLAIAPLNRCSVAPYSDTV